MEYDPSSSAVNLYIGTATGSGASIVWTERNDLLRAGTVRINWSLSSPDQAQVTFIASASTSPPTELPVSAGTPIKITHSGSPRNFGGTIDTLATTVTPGTDKIRIDCQCVSWDRLLTKRRAWAHEYVNQALGDIVGSLILNCMGGDGVSAVTLAGPVIDYFATDYSMTVGDAIAQACQRASDDTDTWYAYIDEDRILYNAKQSTTVAPWNIDDRDGSDSNAFHGDQYQIQGQKTLQKYCNVALARAAKLITDPKTEQFDGDGSTKSFSLTGPVALAPTVMLYTTTPVLSDSTSQSFVGNGVDQTFTLDHAAAVVESITVDGVPQSFSTNSSDQWYWTPNSAAICQNSEATPLSGAQTLEVTYRWDTGETVEAPTEQTVGLAGVDTGKQWYWTRDSNLIEQDSGGSPLTSAQSLSVTFNAYDVGYAKYTFADAVNARAAIEGGTGYYEAYISTDQPITAAGLSALCEAYAKKYGEPPESVTITTDRPGLMTGQLITIHLNDAATDDDFLIDTLSLEVAESRCYWQAHCIAGALIGDVWSALKGLLQTSSTAGGSFGGSTSGSAAGWRTPEGAIDGSNPTFTVAPAPGPNYALLLVLNGVAQYDDAEDYRLLGTGIEYTVPPQGGDWHRYMWVAAG